MVHIFVVVLCFYNEATTFSFSSSLMTNKIIIRLASLTHNPFDSPLSLPQQPSLNYDEIEDALKLTPKPPNPPLPPPPQQKKQPLNNNNKKPLSKLTLKIRTLQSKARLPQPATKRIK